MDIKYIVSLGLIVVGFVSWSDAAWSDDFDPISTVGLYGAEPESAEALAGVAKAQLTRAYIPGAVDFSKAMPPPVAQKVGSCVAHSVGYAARGYYASFESGQVPGTKAYVPSVAYLHSKIRNHKEPCVDSGSGIPRALRFMRGENVPSEAALAADKICEESPGASQRMGFDFRISGFELVASVSKKTMRIPDYDLDVVKQSLSSGHPVLFSMRLAVNSNYIDEYQYVNDVKIDSRPTLLAFLKGSEVYQGSLDSGLQKYASREDLFVGSHAMVAVGYDESRQALLVQNSWGDKWSGNGFGWVSYKAFLSDVRYAMVMKTRVTPPKPALRIDQPSNTALAGELECGFVEFADNKGSFSGFFSSEAQKETVIYEARLRDGENSLTVAERASLSKLPVRPWPVCEALMTTKDLIASHDKPHIRLLSGQESVALGGSLAFEVTTPNYPAFLYLAYLQSDGSVVNLAPRIGILRKQYQPGTKLLFGDGADGRQTFSAQLPLGNEAIIAISSRSPISQLEDLEVEGEGGQFTLPAWEAAKSDGKPVADRLYLTAIRAGLAEQPDTDERVLARELSADVLHLTIRESIGD